MPVPISNGAGDRPPPPGLVVLAGAPSPYHIHLLRRIAEEVPEFRLYSLFSHTHSDADWKLDLPPEIRATHFATGRESVLYPIWRHPLRDWRKGRRLIRFLHDHDVRAVICQGYNYVSYLRLIAHCSRVGIPLFLRADSNIHDDRDRGPASAWAKARLVRWVVRHCRGIMPVGTLGEHYYRRYGAEPERMFRVPLEPDYDALASAPASAIARFRSAHRLEPERRRLLYCGRLVPVKRVDLLIDAFADLADRRPDWDLLIAGDGELRGALEGRVPEKLRSRVTWLGFLQPGEVTLAYHVADVLVLPSDIEPWALVVNEAMATGMVVIASDVVGAAYDLIDGGINGEVFRRGSLDDLRRAILEVTADDALPRYCSAVGPKLEAWRRQADPVAGIRAALRHAGLLSRRD